MTDDEFIRVFEAAMVPHDGWTHEAHIRMAWIYSTREQSLSMAITKAGEGIRRLNEANGVEPELYHETVTGAFMRLVSLRIPELEGDWPQFRDAHPELFDKESPILHRHYSKATLESEAARVAFVAPDKTSFAP